MKYKVTQEYPKEKTLGVGQICLGKDGMCLFLSEDGRQVINQIERSSVDQIHAMGFVISGFEQLMTSKYIYQEWHCIYEEKQ